MEINQKHNLYELPVLYLYVFTCGALKEVMWTLHDSDVSYVKHGAIDKGIVIAVQYS